MHSQKKRYKRCYWGSISLKGTIVYSREYVVAHLSNHLYLLKTLPTLKAIVFLSHTHRDKGTKAVEFCIFESSKSPFQDVQNVNDLKKEGLFKIISFLFIRAATAVFT